MANVTISIPDPLKDFVEQQIQTKGFGNVSEYFRSLVREDQKRETDIKLETLLLEGLNTGKTEITKEYWKDLQGKFAHLLTQHYKKKK